MPAEGRRPALACIGGTECRPKAGTGLHWGTECQPKAGTGHGVPGRRPALACTGARSARPRAGTPVPVRHCLHLGRGGEADEVQVVQRASVQYISAALRHLE